MAPPKQVSRRRFAEFKGVRWNAMVSVCGVSNPTDLNSVQAIAHLAFRYSGEIYNGGHYQYFVNMCNYDHEQVINALVAIGASQAAVLTAAFKLLKSNPITYPNNVIEFLDAAAETSLTEFDRAYFRCERKIESCLMEYLDKHEEDFVEWIP